MSAAPTEEIVPVKDSDFVSALQSLNSAVNRRDSARAVNLCRRLLANLDEHDDDDEEEDQHEASKAVERQNLRQALIQCLAMGLLQQKEYGQVLELVSTEDDDNSMLHYRLYAWYGMQDYPRVHHQLAVTYGNRGGDSSASSSSSAAMNAFYRHLQCQTLHHLGMTKEALECYQDMVDLLETAAAATTASVELSEERMQVWTNCVAVVLANATTPYCRNQEAGATEANKDDNEETVLARLVERQEPKIRDFLAEMQQTCRKSEEEYPYDLAYNLASWQLMTSSSSGGASQKLLQVARQMAEQTLRRDPDISIAEILQETAPISLQEAWSDDFWQGQLTETADAADATTADPQPAFEWVQNMNRALHDAVMDTDSAERQEEAWLEVQSLSVQAATQATLKLSALQRRMCLYNVAVVALELEKFDECFAACRDLLLSIYGMLKTSRPKNKQPSQQQPTQTNNKQSKKGKNKKGKQKQQHQQQTANTTPAAPPKPAATTVHLAAPMTIPDTLWWEARVAVLQACCHERQQDEQAAAQQQEEQGDNGTPTNKAAQPQKDIVPLEAILAKLQSQPSSPVIDHALLYVYLHQKALKAHVVAAAAEESIRLLTDTIPESVRDKPAVLYSLASLYSSLGQEDKAIAILRGKLKDELVLGDFYMSQERFSDASNIFHEAINKAKQQKNKSKDELAVLYARWVQALSHVDPDKAVDIWAQCKQQMPSLDDDGDDSDEEEDDEINGADLETRPMPRNLKTKRHSAIHDASNAATKGKNKKSKEAILRRRAKKREEYLSSLEAKGLYRRDRPIKPDPERWLPKYERYSRRKRGNKQQQQHKGAQGGVVSEKEARQLDIAARIAARQDGSASAAAAGPSTAHYSVSSSGGGRSKGGRRR